MPLRRSFADTEGGGDLLVGQPLADEPQYRPLAFAEQGTGDAAAETAERVSPRAVAASRHASAVKASQASHGRQTGNPAGAP